MPDLSTTYLGLALRNPLVVSASPLSRHIATIRQLADEGAAAIVLSSLFEEQITQESLALHHFLELGSDSNAEAQSYLPDYGPYLLTPEAYVEHLRAAKRSVAIPVIASLNGTTRGGWVRYARILQDAGADAIELNLYAVPTDPDQTGAALEADYLALVREVRSQLRIPLALKLSPFWTSLPHMARQFAEAGADALVLFNRFYQPDFDLEALNVVPRITLSTSRDLLLPLRWIAILYGHITTDFALTGGVHTADDVVKAMMAGASVAMMASELLQHGERRVGNILVDLQCWMEANDYESIRQMQGSMSQRAVGDPSAFERATYIRALTTFDQYA